MSAVPPQSKNRRFPRWVVWGVLVALVVAGWLVWRQTGSDTPPGAPGPAGLHAMMSLPVPVRVATVEATTVDVVLKAIGTVEAYQSVVVRPRVDGELQAVLFEEGQTVQQGDVLARIDPRPFQAQLDEALGQQQQNRALLDNARRELQRSQQMYKQQSISRQQLDAQLALVAQYEGTAKRDQAAVDQARLQLGYTEVRAPTSGRVGLRRIDAGNMIQASNVDGLVSLTQTRPITATFTLPQAQVGAVLSSLRAGQTLAVELYDSLDRQLLAAGRLASADNQIDLATGTLRFKAHFDNEDETLLPNQFVNVRLLAQAGLPALVVPSLAVQQGSRGSFVYVVQDNQQVRMQVVVPGVVDGDRTAIIEGLQAGDVVVIEGVDRLRENARVEVVDEDGPQVPSSGGPSVGPAGAPH